MNLGHTVDGRYRDISPKDLANSRHTYVTSGTGSPGAWVEMIASLPEETDELEVIYAGCSSLSTHGLLDIGIGAAASEQVVVEKLWMDARDSDFGMGETVKLPVKLPKGARVAIRMEASAVTTWLITLGATAASVGSMRGGSRIVAEGVLGYLGTAVPPSGTINTKGPWYQITGSALHDYRGFALCLKRDGTTDLDQFVLLDLAFGSSGNEVVFAADLPLRGSTYIPQVHGIYPGWIFIPVNVMKGVRIAARCQSDKNSAAAGCEVMIYGVVK